MQDETDIFLIHSDYKNIIQGWSGLVGGKAIGTWRTDAARARSAAASGERRNPKSDGGWQTFPRI